MFGGERIPQLRDGPAVAALEAADVSRENIPLESEFALKPSVV